MAVQAQRFLSSRSRWIVFALIVGLGVYLLAVTPVRTYLDQRSEMQAVESRYELLAEANKQMEDRAKELQSDEEIKRLARERYELVPPGTKAYSVMPTPEDVAPQPEAKKDDRSALAKVWDGLTFWN